MSWNKALEGCQDMVHESLGLVESLPLASRFHRLGTVPKEPSS